MSKNVHGKLFCCVAMLFAVHTTQAQVQGNPKMKKTPTPQNAIPKSTSSVSRDLLNLYQSRTFRAQARVAKPSALKDNGLSNFMRISGDRVQIDVTFRGEEQKAKSDLQKLGFNTTAVYGKMMSGSIPISSLGELESLSSLKFAAPAYRPRTLSGPLNDQCTPQNYAAKVTQVYSQGDTAQRSYIARKKYNVDGKGVKVGVLSNSYNNLGGASKGVSQGELPGPGNPLGYKKPVQVIADDTSGTDEGRAMIEIVHDVAPGAELAFNTAEGGQAAFAQGIMNLYNAGCKVITDDVIYFAEPFWQDGIVAQVVDKVKQKGATYFSAAGNNSIRSYESPFRPTNYAPFGPDAGTAHNFSGAGNPPRYFQPLFIPTGGTFICSFQWDQPFYSASNGMDSATTDFDAYLLNDTGAIVAVGGADNIASGEPVEVFGYRNEDSVNQTFYLVLLKYSGPDVSRIKYINYGDGAFYITNPSIPGILTPTLVGHAKADGAIATGAAFYLQTPAYGSDTAVLESFSSEGGVPNYFSNSGKRISPLIRRKPEIVAPDGVNTSFFDPFGDGDIREDSDKYPNFFGTSAAAPHAAGVAALMIQAQKLKTIYPGQIKGILQANTSDMDDPNTDYFDKNFDYGSGYGFIKADAAVGTVKFPNIYIKDLQPYAVCSIDPANYRTWKVYNPNPFQTRVHWQLIGTNQSNDLTVGSHDIYTFVTKTQYYSGKKVPNVLLVDWEDNFGFPKFKIVKSITTKCGDNTVASASELDEEDAISSEKTIVAEVYPNPSAAEFRVYLSLPQAGNAELQLMSIDGRKLLSKIVQGEGVFSIDASSYKSGVYLLQVKQGAFNKVIKLIKQ